jgi:hypothetical protein
VGTTTIDPEQTTYGIAVGKTSEDKNFNAEL